MVPGPESFSWLLRSASAHKVDPSVGAPEGFEGTLSSALQALPHERQRSGPHLSPGQCVPVFPSQGAVSPGYILLQGFPGTHAMFRILGKIPNVTDTQGVRIFQTDRAPTGAEGPAPRVERRLGTGMGFAARRPPLLDSSVLQVLAHARARTCPGSPTACLPAAAAQWCLLHRRSAGRASEIVMQPTSGASVRRKPARPRRLVLMRLQEHEEPEK